MRKLILILIILACTLPQDPPPAEGFNAAIQAVIGCTSSGATAYCTGATTCTATHPGNCDILCEDFEGSSLCYSAYSSNCRSTASAIYTSGTGAVTFNAAVPANPSCSDKGSYAIRVQATAANDSANAEWYFGADKTHTFGQVYIYINSMTLPSYQRLTIFAAYNSSGNSSWSINIINWGGNWEVDAESIGMTSIYSTTVLTAGNWYRIGWEANNDNDTFKLYINGSQEGSTATDFTTTYLQTYFYAGFSSYRGATAADVYIDNIAVSSSALPGSCNP